MVVERERVSLRLGDDWTGIPKEPVDDAVIEVTLKFKLFDGLVVWVILGLTVIWFAILLYTVEKVEVSLLVVALELSEAVATAPLLSLLGTPNFLL